MRLFSTEAISKYHPDKYADQVSDAILTECLRQDKNSHCGIETLVKNDTVVLAGEITTSALLDYNNIVERVARKLGYPVFNIINLIGIQSPEINHAVSKSRAIGAGDQGTITVRSCDHRLCYLSEYLISHSAICVMFLISHFRISIKHCPILGVQIKGDVNL